MSWNPPCKVKYTKVKDNSLQSSKNYFEAHKLIDKIGNILDLAKFRDAAKWLKDKANEKGYFPDLLIYDTQNGKKAAYNIPAFKKLDGINAQIEKRANQQPTLFQKQSQEGQIATEKTLRDLAARMSDRIGIPVRFISDRSQEFKGKIEKKNGRGRGVEDYAVINLAYATLDTPIHEILGHPIVRAIKNKDFTIPSYVYVENSKNTLMKDGKDIFVVRGAKNNEEFGTKSFNTKEEAQKYADKLNQARKTTTTLYQNLLKELETGKGKEVLDRIKRDYQFKNKIIDENNYNGDGSDFESWKRKMVGQESNYKIAYTLEEQQEEAIVELLGLMTAEKLDAVKDGKLISVLKRLLKEIKNFVKDLLKQREVEIDKLPDNMTLGDLSDLLAYSNSKIILPGYEVEYTTPDNMKFKTYSEASKHISDLAKSVKDIDLSNINIRTEEETYSYYYMDRWFNTLEEAEQYKKDLNIDTLDTIEKKKTHTSIKEFLVKNKEYEQSKEIIEEWKKVNNIRYNPEEIYSRGQEFSSVIGAYSAFDVDLMMQNLLHHIEDNEKAGGKFAISAYTKPIDKQIGHLEGGGGRIKFKIYPQSEDILWAANTDVYSGSVWDASEKVNKDKKSELLGVSYTKYPSLRNVEAVQPNLASIVDDLAHHHNELGIVLTGRNFRLEYDDNIPYQTKKIIDANNAILDQKYGKLVKPDLSIKYRYEQNIKNAEFNADLLDKQGKYEEAQEYRILAEREKKKIGIQPLQTKETLKESIGQVTNKLAEDVQYGDNFTDSSNFEEQGYTYAGDGKFIKRKEKEYTSKALINTKIAALKEVAKKYPLSLIRSEVKKIDDTPFGNSVDLYGLEDDLPFQKLSEKDKIKDLYKQAMALSGERIEEKLKECE